MDYSLSFLNDSKLLDNFQKVAEQNGTTPDEILLDFIKDYVVSCGHPETVCNKWPWNKKDK